jgi:hypothetical protein
MYAGFIGAYRRNTALLMFYFIVSLLGALALIAGFVVTSVGVSLAVLHDCQQTAGCDARAEAPKDVTIITAIVFAFTIVPLLLKARRPPLSSSLGSRLSSCNANQWFRRVMLQVVGAVLALVTRREILISRAEATLKLSLMMEVPHHRLVVMVSPAVANDSIVGRRRRRASPSPLMRRSSRPSPARSLRHPSLRWSTSRSSTCPCPRPPSTLPLARYVDLFLLVHLRLITSP